MNRHFHHDVFCVIVTIIWGLLAIISCDSSGRRSAMLAVLDEADSLNRSYVPITSDSLLKEASTYFDHHGTSNERLRAHYLLGCAYRDMGDAPHAIEIWQDAVTCADTKATDCDYHTLGKVYSQMGNLFYYQLLLSDEIVARKQAYRCALMSGDTLAAIHEYKMMATPFLLQNKNDSAENILKGALSLYRKHGYHQEELKASTMLMYIYAEQPSSISALKDLIDRYEAECTLFDENHELPPSKRQFYYYKGRYYESVNLLDSAEICYRKIFRPDMSPLSANPMYKGLLSVYQKKQKGDSIAKYADLYCASMDSSAILKDRELTAQMAASYNYNHYQKQALGNAEKVKKLLAVICLFIALSLIALCVFFVFRNRKNKDINQKIREIELLQKTIVQMEEGKDSPNDHLEEFEESDIVIRLRQKAGKKESANVAELTDLKDAAIKHIPVFIQTLGNTSYELQRHETYLCILIKAGFRPSEIAILMNMTPQNISNLRARLNKKMFHTDKGAKDFNEKIINLASS